MPLQKQELQINFTEGVDTKTDDKLANKPEVVQNINIDKTGTYRKRFGFNKINGSADLLNGNAEKLAVAGDSLGVVTTTNCYSYSSVGIIATGDKFSSSATINVNKKFVTQQGQAQRVGTMTAKSSHTSFTSQVISCGGYVFCYSEDDSGASQTATITILDASTNSVIKRIALFPGAVFNYDSNYLYYYYIGTGSARCSRVAFSDLSVSVVWSVSLATYTIDLTNLREVGVGNLLISGSDTSDYKPRFILIKNGAVYANYKDSAATISGTFGGRYCDADYDSLNDVVYQISANAVTGGTQYRLLKYTIGTSTAVITTRTYNQVSTAFSTERKLIGGIAYNPTTGNVFVCMPWNYYDGIGDANVTFIYNGSSANFGTGTVSATTSEQLISQPYYFNGSVYCIMQSISLNAPSTYLCSVDNLPYTITTINKPYLWPVCKLTDQSYELQVAIAGDQYSPMRINSDGTNLTLGLSNKTLSAPVFGVIYEDTIQKYAIVKLSNIQTSQSLDYAGVSHIGNGASITYDSDKFRMGGFSCAPEVSLLVSSTGGTIAAGTYNYKLIFKRIDARGNITLSAPSVDFNATTTGSTSSVRIAYNRPIISGVDDGFEYDSLELGESISSTVDYIEVYRKLSTDLNYTRVLGTSGFISNTPLLTITDTGSIDSTNLLYTAGGILENQPYPPMESFVQHASRIFAVDTLDRNRVYYSKPFDVGFAPEFPGEEFSIICSDSRSGANEPIIACGSLDDKLIIFKDDSVFAVFGDGPNSAGQGVFSEPKLISSDVGCSNPSSVVLTSAGLMFQSKKGIWLLDRSLALSYIGADIEDFNDLVITSASNMAKENQVRFTTRSGAALIYNYYYNQWSTYLNHISQDAIIYKDKFTHLTTSGLVNVENTGFTDNGSTIELRIKNGWIKLDQLVGYQRIYKMLLIGTYKSSHTIKVKIYYDYEDYAFDTYTVTPLGSGYNTTTKPSSSTIYTGGNDGVYQWQIGLNRQKCEAIKIELYDENITGESCSLTGLGLIIGLKQGLNKLASNKRF